MTTTPITTTRLRTIACATLAAAGMLVATLALRPSPVGAQGTSPTPINTVVVRMSGSMKLTLDKTFVKTLNKAKAKVRVKGGAKLKGRNITLPVDASTAVVFDPINADIVAGGLFMIRKNDGRKVLAQDVALRLRASGADLGATLRGRPEKELGALTLSPTTAVQSIDSGYKFVDLQMLVSTDLASAAREAKIKGVKAGALLGILNAEVRADLPSFTLPGIGIGGEDVDLGNLFPAPTP